MSKLKQGPVSGLCDRESRGYDNRKVDGQMGGGCQHIFVEGAGGLGRVVWVGCKRGQGLEGGAGGTWCS